jgi:hypothetical protein
MKKNLKIDFNNEEKNHWNLNIEKENYSREFYIFRMFLLIENVDVLKLFNSEKQLIDFDQFFTQLRTNNLNCFSKWNNLLNKSRKNEKRKNFFNILFREYFSQNLFSLKIDKKNNYLSILIIKETNIKEINNCLNIYLMKINKKIYNENSSCHSFFSYGENFFYLFGWGAFINHKCNHDFGFQKIGNDNILENVKKFEVLNKNFNLNKQNILKLNLVYEGYTEFIKDDNYIKIGEFFICYSKKLNFICNCENCNKKKN